MIFFTYNDSFSGIYKSQVIDVCSFLEKKFSIPVKLIALVSIRSYSKQKRLIKLNYANALVLPMFPKVRYWKLNTIILFLICFFLGENKIWARGPFACNIAIYLKKLKLVHRVLFDGRGAYQAELTEYNVVEDSNVKNNIEQIERIALLRSDAQLAVSTKLVEWWKEKYSYASNSYAIIPCTLSDFFCKEFINESEWMLAREKSGFKKEDIVLVYSGSSAGWQSFSLVDDFLHELFSKNVHVKLFFLSDAPPSESRTFKKFPDRINTQWLKPEDVSSLLITADYGILIRESSITNKVASPVKFAEYLACGLQVLISEGIGDFTDFVKKEHCGLIFNEVTNLQGIPFIQKAKTHQLALQYFSKEADNNKEAYKKLLAFIG